MKKGLLDFNLQYFAEEEPTPAEPAAEPKNTDTEPPQGTQEPTKTEPNPIPYDRFKEVNDGLKSFKSLGFDSADELKAKLDALTALEKAEEERKKAEMTEAERLKAEKEEADKKAAEAAEEAKKALEAANKRIIDTEIRAIARSLNANDPSDVLALMDKSGVEINEDGSVKGVEEAVAALKEAKPWMFKAPVGADAAGGSNPAKTNDNTEIAAKWPKRRKKRSRTIGF